MTNTYFAKMDAITSAIKAANIIKSNIVIRRGQGHTTTQLATYARNTLQVQGGVYRGLASTKNKAGHQAYSTISNLYYRYSMMTGGNNVAIKYPEKLLDKLIQELEDYDEFAFWTTEDDE